MLVVSESYENHQNVRCVLGGESESINSVGGTHRGREYSEPEL
jgi:hypothetical protein